MQELPSLGPQRADKTIGWCQTHMLHKGAAYSMHAFPVVDNTVAVQMMPKQSNETQRWLEWPAPQ